jgi:hypothetical protein
MGGTAGSSAGGSGGGAGTTGTGGTGGTTGTGGAAGATGGRGGSAGGAGGSGGSAGAAGGTGGSGGSAGGGGSAGASGGKGGAAAGAGGTAGSGGTGGAGGGAGSNAPNLRFEYMNSSATATTFSLRVTNLGPSMPLISSLRARYYFSDDADRNATPMVTSAIWQIASPSTMINLRSTGGCGATAAFTTPPHIDFGCYLGSPMNAQDTITISISVDPATQLAANDYSYADTAGAFAANDHLALFLNNVLQSGTPPP